MFRPIPVFATRRRGFSLVLSLTVMAMLLLLCLTVAALMSVELQVARSSVSHTKARMNARMGMRIALGELQRLAGPDRRVTANALLLNTGTDPAAAAGDIAQPRLVGVWQGGTVVKDYAGKRVSEFRGWLASGLPATGADRAKLLDYVKTAPKDGVTLLAAPATAPETAAIFKDPDAAAVVVAPEVLRDGDGAQAVTLGRIAWWVSDESQKAPLNLRVDKETTSVGDALARRANAPGYALNRADDGALAQFPYDRPLAFPYLSRSAVTTELVGGKPWLADLRPYFHHITPRTAMMLTDCANGGLRYDLSQIWGLRSALPEPYGNAPNAKGADDYIGLEWKAGPGDPQDDYAQAKRVWADRLTEAFAGWDTLLSDNKEEWSTWYDLWQYGNLHHDDKAMAWAGTSPVLLATTYDQVRPDRPVGSGDLFGQDSSHMAAYRNPLITHFQAQLGLIATAPGGGAPQGALQLKYTVAPAVQLWNPSNLPLRFSTDANDDLTLAIMKLGTATSVAVNGTIMDSAVKNPNDMSRMVPNSMSLRIKETGTLAPGAVQLYAPQSTAFTNQLRDIDLVRGSNPTGGYVQDTLFTPVYVQPGDSVDVYVSPVWRNVAYGLHYPTILVDEGRYGGIPAAQWLNRVTGRVLRGVEVVSGDPARSLMHCDGGYGAAQASVTAGAINTNGGGFMVAKQVSQLNATQPSAFAFFSTRLKTEQESVELASRFGIWGDPTRGWMRYFDNGGSTRGRYYEKYMGAMECLTTRVTSAMDSENRIQNYLGTGFAADSGVPAMVMSRVPVSNITSLGALRHARLGGGAAYQRNYPYQTMKPGRTAADLYNPARKGRDGPLLKCGYSVVWDAFGNSWAHPGVPAAGIFADVPELASNPMRNLGNQLADNNGQQPVLERIYDFSWIMNTALWDSWYVSSLQADVAGKTLYKDPNTDPAELAKGFFDRSKKLRNPRMLAVGSPDLAELGLAQSEPAVDAAFKLASAMAVDGGFNINSTSVRAWRALLEGLRDFEYLEYNGGAPAAKPIKDAVAVAGMTQPAEPAADANDHARRMTSGRRLTDAQLDKLAVELVKQVRARGPFLSLGEFVNRRLDATEYGRTGAVQAAIDKTDINAPLSGFGAEVASAIRTGAANPDAAAGKVGVGLPGYVRQADVLAPVASELTARGDTFTVRVLGESSDGLASRAWCEVVMQRLPEYVDATDTAYTPPNKLQSVANKAFGRRFRVVVIHWLDDHEV